MAVDFGFLPVADGEHYFISYNTEDAGRVRPVVQALHRAGVPLWYDYGLEYGKEWEHQIARAIHSAKAVIMFVTDGVFRKERAYVRKEYDIADTYGVRIIPVVLDSIDARSLPEHSIGWWMDVRALHSVQCAAVDGAETLCGKIMHALGVLPAADPAVVPDEPQLIPFSSMSAEELNKLGEDFYLGRNGKRRDFRIAAECFREAAERGFAKSQFYFGCCLAGGDGVARSRTEAVEWLRKSADQGYRPAIDMLGKINNE